MRRPISYIGQSVYEWLFTRPAQDNMVALGKLAAAVLGTSTMVNGLAVTPTAPASLQVNVAPGEIYALSALEATVYGSLPADTTHQIVKQGISLDTVPLTITPPGTSGQSINYLVQATFAEQDISVDPTTGNSPVVMQFYNASNPQVPWSGPNNSGQSSNTFRQGSVVLSAKAGIAATTGSQVTPSPDPGCVGLYVVTVANGQATITSGNIAAYSGAPIIAERLGDKISQASADARYLQLANASSKIQSISASVASNTMTIGYAGGVLDFRSPTLTNGAPISGVSVSADSITIPSGATLGTTSGQQSQIVRVEYYNGGSPVAGVINLAGGTQLDETNLVSPISISSGATSANTFYSASAVTGPTSYRVLGVVTSTQATAGTWATAPTSVQGVGGQAFGSMSSYGFGQSWQDVTASRAFGTTYYNNTGKMIKVKVYPVGSGSSLTINCNIGGTGSFVIGVCALPSGVALAIGDVEVPPGASYVITQTGGTGALNYWRELR